MQRSSARFAPATRRAETQMATTGIEPRRSHLLGPAAAAMASMVGRSGHRETRDGGRLASHSLSSLLALALPN